MSRYSCWHVNVWGSSFTTVHARVLALGSGMTYLMWVLFSLSYLATCRYQFYTPHTDRSEWCKYTLCFFPLKYTELHIPSFSKMNPANMICFVHITTQALCMIYIHLYMPPLLLQTVYILTKPLTPITSWQPVGKAPYLMVGLSSSFTDMLPTIALTLNCPILEGQRMHVWHV